MIPQLGLLLATAAAFAPTRINKYSLSTRLGATPLGANLPLVITMIDARPVEGEPGVYDFDISICGKKVHVLWNWWDLALLGRRALNSGRRALGKVGDEGKQGDGKLIADASTLVYRESNDLNKQVEGFVNRRTGHGYQAVDGALDYYLAEL